MVEGGKKKIEVVTSMDKHNGKYHLHSTRPNFHLLTAFLLDK